VSVSSSTLTKLLIVSRTSLTLNGVAWVSLWPSRRVGVAIVAMVKLRNLQVNHHLFKGMVVVRERKRRDKHVGITFLKDRAIFPHYQ